MISVVMMTGRIDLVILMIDGVFLFLDFFNKQ